MSQKKKVMPKVDLKFKEDPEFKRLEGIYRLLNNDEKTLLNYYRGLPTEGKATLLATILIDKFEYDLDALTVTVRLHTESQVMYIVDLFKKHVARPFIDFHEVENPANLAGDKG